MPTRITDYLPTLILLMTSVTTTSTSTTTLILRPCIYLTTQMFPFEFELQLMLLAVALPIESYHKLPQLMKEVSLEELVSSMAQTHHLSHLETGIIYVPVAACLVHLEKQQSYLLML